jgi:hypothetical protein
VSGRVLTRFNICGLFTSNEVCRRYNAASRSGKLLWLSSGIIQIIQNRMTVENKRIFGGNTEEAVSEEV